MNKHIYTLTLICITLLIQGCASLGDDTKDVDSITSAGVSSFKSEVVTNKDQTTKLGTNYVVNLGKEYASFKLELKFDAEGKKPELTITANGVTAFVGQASAHEALVKIRNDITEQNIKISEDMLNSVDSLINALKPVPFL